MELFTQLAVIALGLTQLEMRHAASQYAYDDDYLAYWRKTPADDAPQ
ncbi:TPA: hypothetical protein L4967_004941 [Pseudomonas aeruginosa]|nr:hypothetical protein [Pseudomonas aeruginosa]MBX6174758.1 hypothetical protein [Pseudomonas aeruginosa]HBO7163472.1 hypothetical protein [Pseudomonas aeruginosa]HEP9173674.1 hypothetical protein [Pseudomonas aeruginosa]